MAKTKSNFGLAEIIAIAAICIILYMLFTGYRGASQQDIVVLERGGPQFVPVFFGGRGGRRCPGPGPCPPKGPKKGPKLPNMPVPKIPKIPMIPKIPKFPKIPLPPPPAPGP